MYKVLLLTPDGEDFQLEGKDCKTIEDASEVSADMGSRWFFYPFHFIIKEKHLNYYKSSEIDKQRILETPCSLEFLKNRTVKTARIFLKDNPEMVEALLS